MAALSALPDTTPTADRLLVLHHEAQAILNEDIAMCRRIGENGLPLLGAKQHVGILTHCNAGMSQFCFVKHLHPR